MKTIQCDCCEQDVEMPDDDKSNEILCEECLETMCSMFEKFAESEGILKNLDNKGN